MVILGLTNMFLFPQKEAVGGGADGDATGRGTAGGQPEQDLAPGWLWDTGRRVCPTSWRCERVSGQNHLENTPEKKDKTPTFNIVEHLCQVKLTFLKKYK